MPVYVYTYVYQYSQVSIICNAVSWYTGIAYELSMFATSDPPTAARRGHWCFFLSEIISSIVAYIHLVDKSFYTARWHRVRQIILHCRMAPSPYLHPHVYVIVLCRIQENVFYATCKRTSSILCTVQIRIRCRPQDPTKHIQTKQTQTNPRKINAHRVGHDEGTDSSHCR
jgi:hypothetical protein